MSSPSGAVRRPPRVLFLALEFTDWKNLARHVSYSSQLGLEEGLTACGIRPTIITAPLFPRAQQLCKGQKFDQVWVEIARGESRDETILEWAASLAPVRVGLMVESLRYT